MIYKYKHVVLPEEVDVFKVVHYSNYLKWCSTALVNFFGSNKLGAGIFDEGKTEMRVGRVSIVYNKSARFQDNIEVQIIGLAINKRSLDVKIKIMRGNEVLVRAKMTIAFVSSVEAKLVEVPKEVANLVEY